MSPALQLSKCSPFSCGGMTIESVDLVSGCRLKMKDYTAWHSRVSNLIYFLVLLAVGAIVGVVTTLNAVGYLSSPQSEFLTSGFTATPPLADVRSSASATNDSQSTSEAANPFTSNVTSSPSVHEQSASETEDAEVPVSGTTDGYPKDADTVQLVTSSIRDPESSSESTNSSATSVEDLFLDTGEVMTNSTEAANDLEETAEDDAVDAGEVDLSSQSQTSNSTSPFDVDDSLEERTEPVPIFDSEFTLMPDPVDLSSLSDVYHDLSDAELLLRASSASMRRSRPKSVTPKVSYLFLTRGPLPMGALWERYFRGHSDLYSIYIHGHPNYLPKFPSNSVFYRRNIPSKEVFWGKLSVFAAERRLLANALLDPANEIFVLLSESCIPIATLPIAYKYYMESEHSFVDAYVNLGKGGMGRYNRIKDRRKLNPEIRPSQWRKGSQWFEMSRALALMVVADRQYYPKFEDFLCRGNCICYIDEHYLATVLTILAPSKLANRTSHYIDFTRSTAHPHQWDKESIDELTLKKITTGHNCTYNGQITEKCHMFARKFSPGTLEPLLELAATSFGIP